MEGLLAYCLICGKLGHVTKVCKELVLGENSTEQEVEKLYGFKGLDVEFDLRGNLISTFSRRSSVHGGGNTRLMSGRWGSGLGGYGNRWRSEPSNNESWRLSSALGESSNVDGVGFESPGTETVRERI